MNQFTYRQHYGTKICEFRPPNTATAIGSTESGMLTMNPGEALDDDGPSS